MDGLTKIIPLSVPRGRYRGFSEFNWFVPVCAINQCFFVDNDENENGLWPIFIYLFIYLFIIFNFRNYDENDDKNQRCEWYKSNGLQITM